MNRLKYQLTEALCVILLVIFVIFLFRSQSAGTDKKAAELAQPVLEVMDMTEMTAKAPADAAKTFGYDRAVQEDAVYWTNESVMDVSELLIIKLNDRSDGPAVREAIEKWVEEQKNLYKNYAPEQYSLLENCVLETKGNTVFFCTAENAQTVYDTFKKAM